MPQLEPTSHRRRLIVPAALIVIGAVVMAWGLDLQSRSVWIARSGTLAPLLFVISSVIMMTLFLPKTAVSLTAGALFGTLLGSVLLAIVAVIAALLNYGMGRWWLQASVARRVMANQAGWLAALRATAGDAGLGLHLLVRLCPIPTTVISYSMGAAGARLKPFLSAAFLAVAPQTLWVHSGAAATSAASSDGNLARWLGAVISLGVACMMSVVVPREALRRIREAQAGTAAELP